jgi:hypothetical protein
VQNEISITPVPHATFCFFFGWILVGGEDAIALKDELDHLTVKLKTWCMSCCLLILYFDRIVFILSYSIL